MLTKLTVSSLEYFFFLQRVKINFDSTLLLLQMWTSTLPSCNCRHNIIMNFYSFFLPIDKPIFVVCMLKISLTLSFAVEGKGEALFLNWSLRFPRPRVVSSFKNKRVGKMLAHARDLEARDAGLGAPKIWRPPPSLVRACVKSFPALLFFTGIIDYNRRWIVTQRTTGI